MDKPSPLSNSPSDPFVHHPELRDKIAEPLTSFFRDFDVKSVLAQHPELDWVLELLHTPEQREISRKNTLVQHAGGDLWIFAYGSLMWDPAFIFAEMRRAVIPNYARRFILKDIWGARGTVEAPGLMAALDKGNGCEGLIYRIAHDRIEIETEILWRREMVGPGYQPAFVEAVVDGEPVRVLTFVADHSTDAMQGDLTRNEQIAYFATGAGFLGSSLEYLENIVSQFAVLSVVDEDCTALLHEVEKYMQANSLGVHAKKEEDAK